MAQQVNRSVLSGSRTTKGVGAEDVGLSSRSARGPPRPAHGVGEFLGRLDLKVAIDAPPA